MSPHEFWNGNALVFIVSSGGPGLLGYAGVQDDRGVVRPRNFSL